MTSMCYVAPSITLHISGWKSSYVIPHWEDPFFPVSLVI